MSKVAPSLTYFEIMSALSEKLGSTLEEVLVLLRKLWTDYAKSVSYTLLLSVVGYSLSRTALDLLYAVSARFSVGVASERLRILLHRLWAWVKVPLPPAPKVIVARELSAVIAYDTTGPYYPVSLEGVSYRIRPTTTSALQIEGNEAYVSHSSMTAVCPEPAFVVCFLYESGALLGTGSRFGKYVLSADHVWDAIETSIAAKKKVLMCHGGLSSQITGKLSRVFVTHKLDVNAVQFPESTYAQLGVKSVNLADPRTGVTTHLYAPLVNHQWSGGMTKLESSGKIFEFEHMANTVPGHSGAPLIQDGKLVGIHLRTHAGRNYGLSTACVRIVLDGITESKLNYSDSVHKLDMYSDRDENLTGDYDRKGDRRREVEEDEENAYMGLASTTLRLARRTIFSKTGAKTIMGWIEVDDEFEGEDFAGNDRQSAYSYEVMTIEEEEARKKGVQFLSKRTQRSRNESGELLPVSSQIDLMMAMLEDTSVSSGLGALTLDTGLDSAGTPQVSVAVSSAMPTDMSGFKEVAPSVSVTFCPKTTSPGPTLTASGKRREAQRAKLAAGQAALATLAASSKTKPDGNESGTDYLTNVAENAETVRIRLESLARYRFDFDDSQTFGNPMLLHVGSAIPPRPTNPKPHVMRKCTLHVKSEHAIFDNLVWPDRSAKAEERSLILQSGNHVPVPRPPLAEAARAVSYVCANYPKTPVPTGFSGPSNTVSPEQIRAVLLQMKQTSSPGYPWSLVPGCTSKADAIRNCLFDLTVAVTERLHRLEQFNPAKGASSIELLRQGLVDPLRVFVKDEPHSTAKAAEGRWRLICSVSIVDEAIERLLCSGQNQAEIATWETTPSKPGMGFSEADSTALIERVKALAGDGGVVETDVSGWDWCMQSWMFDMEIHARMMLSGASADSSYRKILRARLMCLGTGVFITSGGKLFAQRRSGVMKSGSYLTSSMNSRVRVMCAIMCGSKWCVSMGDDALEGPITEGLAERYKALGLRIKAVNERTPGSFEFCSNQYSDGVAHPQNWAKGLFRLLESPASVERLWDFVDEFRHSPQLANCKSIISGSGWVPKDDRKEEAHRKRQAEAAGEEQSAS